VLDQSRLDQVVDEVARITGRNVTLDDVFSRVLAYNTSHPTTDRARIDSVLMKSVSGEARTWEAASDLSAKTRPFILPANPELGFLARVCIPLVSRGFRAGYLWILVRDEKDDPGPILNAVAGLGTRIEEFAHAVMEASEPGTQDAAAKENALWAVLRGSEKVDPGGWPLSVLGSGPISVVAFSSPVLREGGDLSGAEQLRLVRHGMDEAQRGVHVPLLWAASIDHVAAVMSGQVSGHDFSVIRKRFGQVLALHGVSGSPGGGSELAEVGISEVTQHPGSLPLRYREAVAALQAGVVDERLAGTPAFGDIGIYQFLSQTGTGVLPRSSKLAAIEAAPNGEELLSMLERIYDYDGPRNDLAAELHIHRTSLYHRLRRIGKIVGQDPLTSLVRLDLHVALKARRWASRPLLRDAAEATVQER
jgi:hypothetical protein